MKFKNKIIHILVCLKFPHIFRYIFQKKKLTILYYHDINSADFENHIDFLKKYYSIITLNDFLLGRSTNTKYRLLITFDDGHIGNARLLPILEQKNTTITIFLTSGLVNTNRHFWFLGLQESEKKHLKSISDADRLAILAEKYDYFDEKEFNKPQALNLDQINKMSNYVDFQSHTVTHPCLPNCSAEKSKLEILRSKFDLEQVLSKPITCLAFPNGDYTDREIQIAQSSGYKYLFTTKFGFNKNNDRILKRISTKDTNNIE